ncbi:heparan-alpha-glucosaminide N-acetyltransferase domain-containing protein [Xanthomonas sp. SHU 166]|uniref:DUF1624 domain-containing protein n=1 Tax=Xanthomonas sp. SHU 166 TaxID=1591170 RepID=UPI0005BA400A|nr:heparan-alpha-glucosaminide N-acetyltransferase domain-containing protein [Xanthomonas sp. SHU 166]
MPSVALASPASLAVPATPAARLAPIDLLRGTVMLLMLLDHVRETFYLHHPVGDPMEVEGTAPALFVARTLAHLCAPVFVFLTGLSAWLYASRQADGRAAAARFLLKRGLFLIVLELTLVNLAWSGAFPPQALYLQVIWVIGLSMLALAALLWLPLPALALLGAALVALLDAVQVQGDGPLAAAWAVLHDRRWLELGELRLRTSYPVLPWIGVIALGYAAGPWYGAATDPAHRQQRLLAWGLGALAGFHLLRWHNGYGDAPWQAQDDLAHTAMSFFNVTKYPPSLQFLLLTLGVGLLLLRLYEHPAVARTLAPLATIGAAPMFFYLLHLYVLKLAYLAALALWGANQGDLFGVDSVAALWTIAALLGLALYWPTAAFARLKARRRDLGWLRYF